MASHLIIFIAMKNYASDNACCKYYRGCVLVHLEFWVAWHQSSGAQYLQITTCTLTHPACRPTVEHVMMQVRQHQLCQLGGSAAALTTGVWMAE